MEALDVPVLLLFFSRVEQTKRVFEKIRKVRPKKLYLFQDGPRENFVDEKNKIKECRNVIEGMIDWNCEVHRNYHDNNLGCDPSGYLSRKWVFETESKAIILEDDCVPDESFFRFCQEMLMKYEFDERIQMVCGFNPVGIYKVKDFDYFFSKVGSIWGWATWKRVVDGWDAKYSWMESPEKVEAVLRNYPTKYERDRIYKAFLKHRNSGIPYFETINAADMMLNSRLAINPCRNLISNCGICSTTTHAVDDLKLLPKASRVLFYSDTYPMAEHPVGPEDVTEEKGYKKCVDKQLGNNFVSAFMRRWESRILFLKYGGIHVLVDRVKRKIIKQK